VRIEAARILVSSGAAGASSHPALTELETVLRGNLERPDAWLTLANLQMRRGEAAEAERSLRAALRIDPQFVPAYVNLADLYRATQRETEAEALLREAIAVTPAAALYESLGLSLVRQGRKNEALGWLARAVKAEPQQARHAYVYALALDDAGRRREAIGVLDAAAARTGERDVLLALAQVKQASGDATGSAAALRKLAEINPEDPALAELRAR
jgi:tetratricopeptide (TPR) repeat protein